MARKTKTDHPVVAGNIDVEDLVSRVALAVGKQIALELKEVLKDLPRYSGGGQYRPSSGLKDSPGVISMDESIVPMAVKIDNVEGNMNNMAKVETTEDQSLGKSKDKLAALFKKKKKE